MPSYDYASLFTGIKTKDDYDRLNEEFMLKKQLQQAQIAESKNKASEFDLNKLGDQVLYKAAMGAPLTPQEQAIGQAYDAKRTQVYTDVAGNVIKKPPAFGGLTGGAPVGGGNPAMTTPYDQIEPLFQSPNVDETAATNDGQNPWDIEFQKQMAAAAGNPRLQQSIMDAHAKAKISMTESEAKNAGYADRLELAEPVLTDPNKVRAYSNPWERTKDFINPFGAQLNSPDYKSYKQAKNNAASARLRQESGATISPSEYEADAETLYPQVNDGPDIVEQKRQNREILKASMARAAGPAYKPTKLANPYKTPDKVNPPNIPMNAVRELKADPSPENIRYFEEAFGSGAAKMVLNGK
jgi:hypothetical protein